MPSTGGRWLRSRGYSESLVGCLNAEHGADAMADLKRSVSDLEKPGFDTRALPRIVAHHCGGPAGLRALAAHGTGLAALGGGYDRTGLASLVAGRGGAAMPESPARPGALLVQAGFKTERRPR